MRQTWHIGNSTNPEPDKADREARLQTANMASTIIINALPYQQNLDGYNGIKGLAQVRSETAVKELDKDAVVAEFERILSINYCPIFHVAKELLLQIPGSTANDMLEKMPYAPIERNPLPLIGGAAAAPGDWPEKGRLYDKSLRRPGDG